jgi:hypothetical protein
MAIPYQHHSKIKTKTSSSSSSITDFSILRGKPFWIWNKEEHRQVFIKTNGSCCFNHIIGLPHKDKQEFPLFDYEELLFKRLFYSNGDFRGQASLGLEVYRFRNNRILFTNNSLVMYQRRFIDRVSDMYRHRSQARINHWLDAQIEDLVLQ